MKEAQYPDAQEYRSGCKVSWLYYADKEEALKAKEIAQKEARRLSSKGYDFGFQIPGELTEITNPKLEKFVGLFEVCIP